jgi:hypothetical protein
MGFNAVQSTRPLPCPVVGMLRRSAIGCSKPKCMQLTILDDALLACQPLHVKDLQSVIPAAQSRLFRKHMKP